MPKSSCDACIRFWPWVMQHSRPPISLTLKRRISPGNWSMPSKTSSMTPQPWLGQTGTVFMENRANAIRPGRARVVRDWTFALTAPKSGLGLGSALRRNALGPITVRPYILVVRVYSVFLTGDMHGTTRSLGCLDTFRQEALVTGPSRSSRASAGTPRSSACAGQALGALSDLQMDSGSPIVQVMTG